MNGKLWIVGKNTPDENWEFQGVFSSEEKAAAACITSDYWIGPANLDEELLAHSTEWEGSYFPIPVAPPKPEKRHGWRQGSETPICGDVTARRPSDYELQYSNATGPICKDCSFLLKRGTTTETRQGVARAKDETL